MTRTKFLIWLTIVVLIAISVIDAFWGGAIIFDQLQRYTFLFVALLCVGCIVWYFVKDVLMQKPVKKRSQK